MWSGGVAEGVETKGSVKDCKRWTGRSVKSDTLKEQVGDIHLTIPDLSLSLCHLHILSALAQLQSTNL